MAIDRPRNITGGVRRQDETREQFRERMDEARANRGPWPSARTSTGLDEFELMNQEKNRPLADIQREAREASRRGLMYNRNTGGWVDDTMGNRSAMANANPYAQRGLQAGDPQMPPMTEPQMEWARKAQEKQTGVGALGKVGEKMDSLNQSAFRPPAVTLPSTSGAMANSNPYAGTRQQNIANAKAAGEFDNIKADYNRKNNKYGMVMDDEGNIVRDPKLTENYKNRLSTDKAAERSMMSDFNRGIQRFSSNRGSSFTSPYGRGSIARTGLGTGAPTSMVRDEFGRMVPMAGYLKGKAAVQRSKGMI